MKILFLGGDKRTAFAYEMLSRKYEVSSKGLFSGDSGEIESADAIVLPVPATRDNKTVNCALTGEKIPLETVLKAKRGAHIITYGYKFNHYPQTDYSSLDGFCIKNAVSTAEGAIAFAVNHTDFTLFGSKILIVGFGRVGKILLSRLKSFGADICVSARKPAHFAVLEAMGIKYCETARVGDIAKDYDIIFNTVDLPLISDLTALKSTYLFDLSSKGIIDFNAAEEQNLNAFKLPSIPAKTAPLSAGKIIAETVDSILKQNQKY